MTMRVIGAGIGRTGTHSLKLAINRLGFGPCHHMEEVLHNRPVQVDLWATAVAGRPDWRAIYDGYQSAVDWPTAGFFRELAEVYPSAKFILTHRSPQSWAESFSGTIYKVLAERKQAPPELRPWLDMAAEVVEKSGIPGGLDRAGLEKAFTAHNDAVRSVIAADRLLVYEVRDGWGPLCEYLEVPLPDEPFPRTNARSEFWDRIEGA
jgi:hypothetical protein